MNEQLLALISAIYSAASSPEEWPEVARKIQAMVGGHSVHLAMSDPKLHRVDCIFSNGLSQDETRWYNKHIAHQDELTGVFQNMPTGTAFLLRDMFSEDQLSQLSCYEEFYDRVGLNDFAGSYFYREQSTMGWCTVARSKQDRAFTPEQRQLLNQLTPHLAQAMKISMELSAARQSSQLARDALEMLPIGLVLLSSRNETVMYNNRAVEFLSKPTGHEHWSLNLPCPEAQQAMLKAVKGVLEHSSKDQSQCISFSHEARNYTAVVAPWVSSEAQREWLPEDARCMIMINSSDGDHSISLDWLRQRYSLSKSEARVLSYLLTGETATRIAEQLFVTTHTVRFHIKNLLQKTGSTSQVQAVVKVLRDFNGLY